MQGLTRSKQYIGDFKNQHGEHYVVLRNKLGEFYYAGDETDWDVFYDIRWLSEDESTKFNEVIESYKKGILDREMDLLRKKDASR